MNLNTFHALPKTAAAKALLTLSALGLAASAGAQVIPATPLSSPSTSLLSRLDLGLTGGYVGGGGFQVFVDYNNLIGPVGARLSISSSSNGDGFNDDADLSGGLLGTIGQQKANGNISEERALRQTFGLDATYPLGQPLPGIATSVYGGLRYGSFTSRLTYRDGQSTDYKSAAFGVGIGSQAAYLLTRNISIVGDLGVDQYFNKSDITASSGNNTDTFKAGEGGYAAVDNVVNRPGTVFKAMIGVKYSF